MTSPAKPPAPMEPCKICGADMSEPFWGHTMDCIGFRERNGVPVTRRRAAPTDGEVEELVALLEAAALSASPLNWGGFRDDLRRVSAALSRQSAEIAEARDRAVQMEARWESSEEACESATAALTALGCKLGPEGWMRPREKHDARRACNSCGKSLSDCFYESTETCCRNCDHSDYVPIPGAGAKGDSHV